jgi:thymidylate kinase
MVCIEGIRKSGKTYTIDVIRKNFPQVIVYKDLGIRDIAPKEVSIDDFSIGRDFTYAQCLPKLVGDAHKNIVFDRQYWSSYVYGQAWRNKYNNEFWTNHIHKVEETYGDWLKNIHVVFITLTDSDFQRIEEMNRKKDRWDGIADFEKQYDLYLEVVVKTKLPYGNVHLLSAFSNDAFIIDFFKRFFPN